MRIFSFLLFFITAQGISAQMFNKGYVKVPDCVEQLLVDSYGGEEPNAGKFVVNLLDINNTNFCNGVFAFKGQGVHCPRKIFLNKDGLIYIYSLRMALKPLKKFCRNILNVLLLCSLQIMSLWHICMQYTDI